LPFSGILARLRSLRRGLRRRADVEAEMIEEFRHHVALRTEELVRGGLAPAQAARLARIEFGHIDSHRADARASRGLRPFDQIRISTLDVKLGVRMLVKYPGLSAIAVIGMAVAIAIGAGFFGFLSSMYDPTLPLDDGDRVVGIENRDVRQGQRRQSAGDFIVWRDALRGVEDLGAFIQDRRNLIVPGQAVEPVDIAEMTASGFRVARTPPLLGRPLVDEDERPGAPPVLVLAHDEWQRRFAGDSAVVGREVRLGGDVHTIVGVMPAGFHFPIDHRYWTALRLPKDVDPGEGPSLVVFARLADGATLAQAQAELAVLGARMATAYPETHQHLRPRVLPYAYSVVGLDGPDTIMRTTFQLLISLLLLVVAVNVAILIYARTAARAGEIAVRTALGASRARVVAQLFAEALVLCGTAAVIGLAVAAVALARLEEIFRARGDGLPYWVTYGLSTALVSYVVVLAVVAAVVVGVLPALQATGRRVHAGLQQLSSRGSQMQLGRTWTTMIVAQVAVAVAVLPFAVDLAARTVSSGMSRARYPIDEFLRASLSVEREEMSPTTDTAAYRRARALRFRSDAAELLRRLESDPAVVGVAFESRAAGAGAGVRIEIDEGGRPVEALPPLVQAERGRGHSVWTNGVAPNYFSVFSVPMLAGRGFTDADALDGSDAVIVDRAFVDQLLGEGSPIGRRVRYIRRTGDPAAATVERGPWLEVVGVAPDLTRKVDTGTLRVYRATTLDEISAPVSLAIRVRASPASTFAGRLREITAAVDPTLQLGGLQSAAEQERQGQRTMRLVALGIVAATASVLLLSAAGIYAMMSFTVVRRRREIGIRSALGADPRRILGSIFARAGAQLAAGVVIGLLMAVALEPVMAGDAVRSRGVVLLPVVAAVLVVVGLLAALGPARHGLSIRPTEALREE
jgi:predicted permease